MTSYRVSTWPWVCSAVSGPSRPLTLSSPVGDNKAIYCGVALRVPNGHSSSSCVHRASGLPTVVASSSVAGYPPHRRRRGVHTHQHRQTHWSGCLVVMCRVPSPFPCRSASTSSSFMIISSRKARSSASSNSSASSSSSSSPSSRSS